MTFATNPYLSSKAQKIEAKKQEIKIALEALSSYQGTDNNELQRLANVVNMKKSTLRALRRNG